MSSWTPPSNPSPAYQTLLGFAGAMKARDHTALLASFDDSAIIEILPKSLGRPPMDKPTYAEYIKGNWGKFKSFDLTIETVIEAGSIFTVHAASKGEAVSGAAWANEYIIIFQLTTPEAGGVPKIVSQKEFVDSAAMMKFIVEDAAKA
ncbi:hypothetical protein DFH07DRAFT_806625 [Mycena maculata]|uniref:SnoaL-like domain-containing protein n=1 Tax=Mycena maculata TaxID=230809 RepID=A0AAD7JQ95_9AGAR|nr:hypothetical protein DFH07DRAFT_806625 [Mycena maculata]